MYLALIIEFASTIIPPDLLSSSLEPPSVGKQILFIQNFGKVRNAFLPILSEILVKKKKFVKYFFSICVSKVEMSPLTA